MKYQSRASFSQTMTNPIVPTYITILWCFIVTVRVTGRIENTMMNPDESRRICHSIHSQTHNYATATSRKSTASGIIYATTLPHDILTVRISAARECLSRGCGHISAAPRSANTRDTQTNAYRHREMRNWLPIPSRLAHLLLTPSVAFRE